MIVVRIGFAQSVAVLACILPRADLCLFMKESAVTGFTRTVSLLVVLVAAPPALAQRGAAPEVTAAHKGAGKALVDLKTLISLTTPQQQKQWTVINKNLQVFLIGINNQKPLKVDMLFGAGGKMTMRPSFPISDLKKFRNGNLTPFGVKTRRIAAALYKCKGTVFEGYMRYKNGYATFAENRTDLPRDMKDPAIAVAPLLAKHDFVLHGVNREVAPASIAARRAWFGLHRKELLALVKKQAEETEADFELRKLMMVQQTNEMERFYAESAQLTTGWRMNLAKLTGRLDIYLKAIPGTDLSKSVGLIGQKPSYFAAIPRADGSILSVRANWPLDGMRKNHTLELVKAIKKSELSRIDAESSFSASEKKAHHDIGDLVEKLLVTNANAGIFDMFTEVHPNKAGSNTAIGAFRTVDGTIGEQIVKLLPKTGKGRSVKMNVAKVDGVNIHRTEVKLSKSSLLKMFLGGGVIYVGTSKDAIWFASGDNALAELTAAIKQRSKPTAVTKKDVFIDLFLKVAPWLELRDKARGPKGNPELRAVAKTAFAGGKDGVSMQLRRSGWSIIGAVDIETNVLRFAGAMVSKFSADTLDSDGKKKKATNLKR